MGYAGKKELIFVFCGVVILITCILATIILQMNLIHTLWCLS